MFPTIKQCKNILTLGDHEIKINNIYKYIYYKTDLNQLVVFIFELYRTEKVCQVVLILCK